MFSKPGVSQANCVLHVHRMGKTDERNSTCGAFFPARLSYHVASSSLAVFLFFVHLFVSLLCFFRFVLSFFLSSFLSSFLPFFLSFFLPFFLSFLSFLSFFLFSVSISLLPPSLSLSPPRRSLNCNSPQLQGVSGEDVECPKLL